jgi:hypothetical protein
MSGAYSKRQRLSLPWRQGGGIFSDRSATISLSRSDHLRRRRFADFLPPEKTDFALTTKNNRPSKLRAVSAISVADNDWSFPTVLNHNVWPFDSVSI